MSYFTLKEHEAYREGRRDAEYGRRNSCDYNEHFGGGIDRAYYDGQREYEREEERRREMYEVERMQEERAERMRAEHRQYMRDMEEQEYYQFLEQQPEPEYPEQLQTDDDRNLPF